MSDMKGQEILGRISALKNDPKALIAIAAVVFLLDIGFVLRFQWNSTLVLFREAKRLKTNIRSTRDDAKLAPTFKSRIDELKKELELLDQKVVNELDLPNALESISKYADIAVVRILKIKPIVDLSAAKTAVTKGGQDFLRQKVSISAKAGFHELGRFMALLENAPVFFDIKSVEIQTDQQEYMKHVVTIVLEVVIKKV